MSESIREAKRLEVFVCRFKRPDSLVKFSNGQQLKISEAWLERRWKYGDWGKIIVFPGYQLIIHTESSLERYSLDWTIGIDGSHYLRSCGKNCLMGDFEKLPDNIVKWPVQNGSRLNSLAVKTIIGSVTLTRID